MDRRQLYDLLEQVRAGSTSVADAAHRLWSAPLEDLGFAKVDHHRHLRCGFPEVIYGPGKTDDQLVEIFDRVLNAGHGCLATRVDADQADALARRFPAAIHDPVGRTVWQPAADPGLPSGKVVVVTAGTGDLPVAKEAETTAKAIGCEARLLVDVGVAGLHRLLAHLDSLGDADVIVVVAGMEGALPSVVGGLVDCPVIAVPTSVGYGANFSGVTALLGMLSSCAANVAVVNIDGGFCAGYVAGLIARRAAGARSNPADA